MMPSVFSFAVLADVHGNSWAVKAVLADISRRSVSKILNLGDCVYGPLDPAGTADLLMGMDLTRREKCAKVTKMSDAFISSRPI